MTRRHFLLGTASLAASFLPRPWAGSAAADPPGEVLTMVVAYAAGGSTDLGARSLARFLERDIGQKVVVVNKPGAGGEAGFTALARAAPDGSTFGIVNTPPLLTLPLERRTRYQPEQLAPVAGIVDNPNAIFVPAECPWMSLADLVAAARAKPEGISYGTTGTGSDDHLAALALERLAGIKLLHVPQAGAAQAKQSLAARQFTFAVLNLADAVPEVPQGQFRLLAQAAATRSPLAPEAPTFREAGYDLVEGALRGLAVPAGTPAPAVERLARAAERVLALPEFQALARQQMLPLRFAGPAEFAAELATRRARYQAIWNDQPWRD
ncbi:tripartite tricarboxylate transporter substrate binding protein [Siccirubricoccus sp. KC 17139]|uniref:Tripartite tricarboxylate transporter substrate binding protein n=1 Tax=Siccirubricoccus soli TaxID=2899147 RepID=A0ABT1D9G7_9PROT|nr:tripartite tricarboxylate transporter substrate binding protein [Siccirubricoccus soli]MCO6417645.1 tripartite tricarboxylate transporter substrate binding protein [Siccirubricoccus soli]MCP2683780.1 tripartite tricarboxylate transporter substrate binding protein [Siccirubricoccus soli]